jgi:GlpG protein
MRQIGTIADKDQVDRLADYLLTLNITTRVDPSSKGGYVVWARREEQVDRAKDELARFLEAPDDPKYQGASQTARDLRKKADRLERQHAKNTVDLRGRWAYRPPAKCVVVLALIVASVLVAVRSNVGEDKEALKPFLIQPEFSLVDVIDPQIGAELRREMDRRGIHPEGFGGERLSAVRKGEIWRLVTPIFVHFGPIHLLFNMFMLYDLGGLIELRRGHLKLALLVLVAAVISNFCQYMYEHNPLFGGMSGVNYALFGFVWMKSKFSPEEGMLLRPDTVLMMIAWLFICLGGAVGHVANTAHFVGLAVGIVAGVAPHWRDLWHGLS